MLNVGEKILLGALGGLVALFFARQRFLSERWWDKKYDVYLETLETLRKLEKSLARLGSVIYEIKTPDISVEVRTAAQEYESALSNLLSLQHKHMLLTSTLTQDRIIVLYSALRVFDPEMVLNIYKSSETERKELYDLVKQSARYAGGAAGETALEARKDLGIPRKLYKKKTDGSILGMSIDDLKKCEKKFMEHKTPNKSARS